MKRVAFLSVVIIGLACAPGAFAQAAKPAATPAPPRLDDFGGDDVHEDFREGAPLGISLEVVRRLLPPEIRVEHHRQE